MGTKVTSSSGSVLEEPEIQKLQMQAKIFKENSLNKLNALKTTIQHLSSSNHSMYYEFREAFHRLFDANEGLFRSVLSRNMQKLEMQFSNETLHEKDSNSELRAIKGQFEHFMHSKMFELSKYNTNAREILQDFNAYTTMEAQTFKETIIQNMDSIEQCIIERASHEQELKMTSGDETRSRIVSDERLEREIGSHITVQNHDENDVFANVRRHSEQPESINDTYVLEKDDSNVIPDSSNICTNDNQVDQNAAECVDERAALANLIANLTLDTEENKTILKQLKKANASLTQELKECKTNLDESSRALGEATSSRDSSLIALQTKQTELEKYTALNDLTSDYKILQTKLNETLGLLALKDIDIKEGLKTKTYEISVVNQKHDELVKKSLLTRSQFEGQLKEKTKVISDLKVKEGKDIDTMIEMDKQIKFLNEILYKRNQSIQTIHMLAPKCATYHGRSTFANPKYLKKAQSDKPRLYEIPYDTSDPANRFCPDGEETVTLENESRSKLDKDTVKPYNYTYQNSLYETFKPPSKAYLDQLERAKEVRKTMWRKTFVRTKPNIAKNVGFLPMSKSISKSRLLYNEMTNNFNHFRTICQQTWSNHTSSAFPNPTAKSMEVLIKILLMPLSDKTILDSHCFIHELKREMNDDLEYVNSLEKELDELESEKADFSNIYDLLLEEVIHTTSVSRPQLKCYQVKDKVVPNNSHVKFQKKEVEDHHRIFSISKKTKSVTACNDSSNSRTSNANAVCAECGTCVFNSNHDACVSRYLKDVNARTKKPHVVPISASKPKRKANKSVATPHKKTVASDTTIQKSKSYYKKLYENTNQEWKWWIAKRCPSVYTWTQKPLRTKKIWMPKIRKDDESTSISPTIDIVSRITNIVQLILFIVDSGCTKHMTGNLKLLCNFVEKFLVQASVFMAMMSDHNSSDLAPQRQEMSVENVSSGLVPQGQKASDYDNSDPVPPRQNVVPLAEKVDSSQQGLEFLFSPLLEEYYNPIHGMIEMKVFGIMPTKIELTPPLEQSQQGVSNDVLVCIEGVEELKEMLDKGIKKRSNSTQIKEKPGQYICCQNHKLIAGFEK
ncbi:hypothetical protein Tco_1033261 [Tanacetum coccineum]|uniref:Integrase, catalytic region, zinc finger, CCHC-type, peptidase aspartic, catalytic n=1 Tax=Tanacetum coccineum TaxID=301880 RepID=A0ABQ5GEQ5_9ASTR